MESRKRPSKLDTHQQPQALQTWTPLNHQTSTGSGTSNRSRYRENHTCTCGASFKSLGGLRRHGKRDPGREAYPRDARIPRRKKRIGGGSKCELRQP